MATIYLRSADGSDGDSGATWALAKATLSAAVTAAGAGGTVYVADGHAESQSGAQTITSPGTLASPVNIICVDDTGDPEPPTAVATTATVTNTGALIDFKGFAFCYGITFTSAVEFRWFDDSNPLHWICKNCAFVFTAGSGTGRLLLASLNNNNHLTFLDTNVTFSAVGESFTLRCGQFTWKGGSVAGTAPTALFIPSTDTPRFTVSGVDLSLLGSGKALVNVASSTPFRCLFENCKLGPSVSETTGTSGVQEWDVEVVNCDSADTNYRYQSSNHRGTITHESTIVLTGGASDGTTTISRKMVSSSAAKFSWPLVSDPIVLWNENTGSSITGAIEVVTDGVTLTDAEAWIEVEYLGNGSFPVSSRAHDRIANILTTPANQTSSSVTWTTTGLSSPVKQTLSVSFTPQEKGLLRFRVYLAKASTTMYVNPEVNISGFTSGRQYQSMYQYINEGESGGSSGGLLTHPGMSGGMRG